MHADQDITVAMVQTSMHGDQGGLSTLTSQLCDTLACLGVRPTLITRGEEDGERAMVPPERPEVSLHLTGRRPRWRLSSFFDPDFSSALESACTRNGCRVIHTHDLWTPEVHLAIKTARRLNIPTVMSITGTLTPWSLKHKAFKKRLGWLLYQGRDLRSATVLHATSRYEAENIRRLGLTNPIAVIPLAVSISPPPPQADHNTSSKLRTVLYLSRIHPKKGLMHLVEAWKTLRPKGWRVVIAGQDDAGYRGELESAIRRYDLTDDFVFRGFVSLDEKARLYREADLFVLPTYSENFGLVIPEALSHSIPVITTRGTPWEELNQYRCGWWTGIGTEPLTKALREAISLPDRERKEMGERGRELVKERYSFTRLGKELKTLYQWLINGDKPPPYVLFD